MEIVLVVDENSAGGQWKECRWSMERLLIMERVIVFNGKDGGGQ